MTDHDLEEELLRLVPARPSKALKEEIGCRLSRRSRGYLVWATLPLAAALALAAVLKRTPAPLPAPLAMGTDSLYATRDEGYVLLGGELPVRKVRETHLDTIVWEDPKGSSLKWTVPRQEVRLIPVNFQ
jgi:hypothetical protein